jgi:branched-chain amino acid transport system permease protein
LTLLFGIMGVSNLAHGSFYMLGAYMAYALVAPVSSVYPGMCNTGSSCASWWS